MLRDALVKIESRHNISHKTIIYTTFFRAAPQGVTLANDTTQDASYTCIFVKTHRLSPPHPWLQSKSDINSWKWLANARYVAEFETYVPYVYPEPGILETPLQGPGIGYRYDRSRFVRWLIWTNTCIFGLFFKHSDCRTHCNITSQNITWTGYMNHLPAPAASRRAATSDRWPVTTTKSVILAICICPFCWIWSARECNYNWLFHFCLVVVSMPSINVHLEAQYQFRSIRHLGQIFKKSRPPISLIGGEIRGQT